MYRTGGIEYSRNWILEGISSAVKKKNTGPRIGHKKKGPWPVNFPLLPVFPFRKLANPVK